MPRRDNDPAALSHIERQYFVNASLQPGERLHYGDWCDSEAEATRCAECNGSGKSYDRNSWRDIRCPRCHGSGRMRAVPITLIERAVWSDYSGSLVEKSNADELKKEFPWLVEVYGSHGTRGVAYLGKRENQNPALLQAINSLTEYCVYNDDAHSQLEWDETERQWSEAYGGRHDFIRALIKHFDLITDEDHEHDPDLLTADNDPPRDDCACCAAHPDYTHSTIRDAVDMLWRDACEVYRGGEDHLNERGESIYFPVYQLFQQISDPRFADYLDRGPYGGDRGAIREQMRALAEASRVKESDNAE